MKSTIYAKRVGGYEAGWIMNRAVDVHVLVLPGSTLLAYFEDSNILHYM